MVSVRLPICVFGEVKILSTNGCGPSIPKSLELHEDESAKVELRHPSSDVGDPKVVAVGGRKYPQRDLKILFGWSAALCAFPGCRRPCVVPATDRDREVVIGKIAHIAAHSDIGPRADPTMSHHQRDSYNNWVLLCPEHHDIVDRQANTFTSEELQSWKREHEQWVRSMYQDALPSVTFAELKVVAQAVLNAPGTPSDSYMLTTPTLKMEKNSLTSQSVFILTMAIGKARDVESFVESMSKLDFDFPERLRAGFILEFNTLVNQGYFGDSLFQALLDFATGISSDFRLKSAGLAVLGYLFEKCEVFEP